MSGNPVEKKQASVPQKKRGFTVGASPYNSVKLELAMALIIGVVVILVQERLFAGHGAGVLVLLVYGCAAALWIVLRVQRVRTRLAAEEGNGGEKD